MTPTDAPPASSSASSPPGRVLLVQLADIGDLILTTPALAALREALPGAHLALLTNARAAPVVAGLGLVDEIITFDRDGGEDSTRALFRPANLRRILDLRRGRYDAVVYFHHFTLWPGTLKFALIGLGAGARRRVGLDNGRGWFLSERVGDDGFGARHQAEYWLALVARLGADARSRPAQVAVAPVDLPAASPGAPRIVIHAGGGGYSTARRWSPAGFAAVAEHFAARGGQVIVVGGPDDAGDAVLAAMRPEARAAVIDLTGRTTLAELAGVLRAANAFVGAESGVMHLAAAVGAPTVAIFGPGNPDAWGPWSPGGRVAVVRTAPECSPCSYVDHGLGLREGCPARTCLRALDASRVIAAAEALLSGETPPAPVVRAPYRFPRRVRILGLPADGITYAEWLDLIGEWVRAHRAGQQTAPRHVCTVNPEFMMTARRDPNFRHILRRADLCVPDGVGVLWAARHLGQPLPERVTGSDGLPIIAERAARAGWRLFLLGAAPGVAEKAAEILIARFPGLQIAGTYSGSPAPDEEDALVARVSAAGADLLFVAYGAPEQDKWIARNLPRLRVAMAMGVGGAFDFVAGVVPRAPAWMRRAGLEWLFRLFRQPWRARRMLRLPRFVLAVLLRGAGG